MPQHSDIDPAFPMRVLDFVAMGLWREIGFLKPVSRRQTGRTREALARGTAIDLMQVLFGTVLSLNDASLILIGCVAAISLFGLALIYRPLVLECIALLRSSR